MLKNKFALKNGYVILLVFIAAGIFPSDSRSTDNDKFSPYIERFSNGRIDWDNGMIYGIGKAYPDMNDGSRAMAARAARVTAMQSILKISAGVNLDDQTVLDQLGKGQVLIHLKALIRPIDHSSEWKTENNRPYIEITLKTPISGVEGLTAKLLGHLKNNTDIWHDFPKKIIAPEKEEDVESWLVIDARGLARGKSIQPALFPKIKSETGETLYELKTVDEKALQNRGMARYVVTDESKEHIEGQTNLSKELLYAIQKLISAKEALADEKKKKRSRFIVKDAIETEGISKVNLIISKDDASQLKAEDASSMILKKCRIIVIVNSPIGGIKGCLDPLFFLSGIDRS